MTKTIFLSVMLLLLITLFSSCRQYRFVYSASKVNTPMLKNKGDARLNTSVSFGGAYGNEDTSKNIGYDMQGAYAVTKNFALTASRYYRAETDGFYTTNAPFNYSFINYKRRLNELGAMVFGRQGDNAVYSLVGGMAWGDFSLIDMGTNDSANYTRNFSTDVTKFFFQPAISIVTSRKLNFDFSVRFSFVDYKNPETNYNGNELAYLRLNDLGTQSAIVFIEPSFTFQLPLAGTDWLKFESNLSFLNNETSRSVRGVNFSLGLTADPFRALQKK